MIKYSTKYFVVLSNNSTNALYIKDLKESDYKYILIVDTLLDEDIELLSTLDYEEAKLFIEATEK